MNQQEDIWTTMMNECRKLEYPVLPVFGGEPWFSAKYLCHHWLQMESEDKFVADCKAAAVPIVRPGRRPCMRLSDVLAMFQRNEGAAS